MFPVGRGLRPQRTRPWPGPRTWVRPPGFARSEPCEGRTNPNPVRPEGGPTCQWARPWSRQWSVSGRSVGRLVGLADLGGDAAALGDVPAVVARPLADLGRRPRPGRGLGTAPAPAAADLAG